MKYINYILLVAITVVGLASCSENDREYFDPSYASLDIWVGNQTTAHESETYNYSYHLGEGSVTFYARITGAPVDYDREFTLEMVGGDMDIAGNSCRLETYVIPAGEVLAECNIYFNADNLPEDAFTETDGHLVFRLKENSNFKLGTEGAQELTIVLQNGLKKPADWDVVTGTPASFYKTYATYFGAYSKVKYQFMISVTGLIDFKIYYSSAKIDEEANTISWDYATKLQQLLQIKLEEYNNTHDTPLTDENGELVTF